MQIEHLIDIGILSAKIFKINCTRQHAEIACQVLVCAIVMPTNIDNSTFLYNPAQPSKVIPELVMADEGTVSNVTCLAGYGLK